MTDAQFVHSFEDPDELDASFDMPVFSEELSSDNSVDLEFEERHLKEFYCPRCMCRLMIDIDDMTVVEL